MKTWMSVIVAASIGATLALPAAAQWKWRDASGRTQYSDTPPPPNVAEKDILQRPNAANTLARAPMVAASDAATAASGVPAPKVVDTELDAKRKKAEQEAADKKKAEDAKLAVARAENCSRAKTQMRSLDSGVRITRTNAKGEREYLDDKARAQEIERTREVLAAECK